MRLNLQWLNYVPPNGVLDFPVVWTGLSIAYRQIDFVGGYSAGVTTHMCWIDDMYAGFLSNLSHGALCRILPSPDATAGQRPVILTVMLHQQNFIILTEHNGGSPCVEGSAPLTWATATSLVTASHRVSLRTKLSKP